MQAYPGFGYLVGQLAVFGLMVTFSTAPALIALAARRVLRK